MSVLKRSNILKKEEEEEATRNLAGCVALLPNDFPCKFWQNCSCLMRGMSKNIVGEDSGKAVLGVSEALTSFPQADIPFIGLQKVSKHNLLSISEQC